VDGVGRNVPWAFVTRGEAVIQDEATRRLEWLLDPVSAEVFFRDYFERKPLLVQGRAADRYREVLSFEALDTVLTTRDLKHPDVLAVDASKQLTEADFTFEEGYIDVLRITRLYADGATLIFNQLERQWPALAGFCRDLEGALSTDIQANIYLTPKKSQGFRPHYDSHDVLVMQVEGRKHWIVYDTPMELPMRRQSFNAETMKAGEMTQEFVLEPGDLFYLPRGVMHDARSLDGDSMHITVGIKPVTWADALVELVAQAALEDVDLRRSLPPGYARPGYDRNEARATLLGLLQRIVEGADADHILDHYAGEHLRSRAGVLGGQLAQMRRMRGLDLDARVAARPHLVYAIDRVGEKVRLTVNGGDLELPHKAEAALRDALTRGEFAVRDLGGGLDEAGRLVLVRRLVREGCLRIV